MSRVRERRPKTEEPKVGITAGEHWTKKGEDVGLFLFEKTGADTSKGTVLFMHGSSMASALSSNEGQH